MTDVQEMDQALTGGPAPAADEIDLGPSAAVFANILPEGKTNRL